MSTQEAQVIDNVELTGILDYDFAGDNNTASRKRTFIIAYHEHGSIYHAALATPVSRKTVYVWMERDPVFAQAVKDAHEDCADDIETSVFKRAKTDSLLAMFYLKAKRPAFRDKVSVDIPTIQNQVKDFIRELIDQAQARGDSVDTAHSVNALDNKKGAVSVTHQLQPAPATVDATVNDDNNHPLLAHPNILCC